MIKESRSAVAEPLTVSQILAQSSNVGTVKIAQTTDREGSSTTGCTVRFRQADRRRTCR